MVCCNPSCTGCAIFNRAPGWGLPDRRPPPASQAVRVVGGAGRPSPSSSWRQIWGLHLPSRLSSRAPNGGPTPDGLRPTSNCAGAVRETGCAPRGGRDY